MADAADLVLLNADADQENEGDTAHYIEKVAQQLIDRLLAEALLIVI